MAYSEFESLTAPTTCGATHLGIEFPPVGNFPMSLKLKVLFSNCVLWTAKPEPAGVTLEVATEEDLERLCISGEDDVSTQFIQAMSEGNVSSFVWPARPNPASRSCSTLSEWRSMALHLLVM
ncbi:MAG: hypothetical protein Ct9H90mP16_10320 [Candidatus Poseidoniales archaeon]|nr:MAG: hypothetical protein Ct9H90mP16_10320 [Candidatus Poseidoniales archaeon]